MGMQWDPIEPETTIDDYLKVLTQFMGQDTATFASVTAAPSKPRMTFTCPPIGLASRILLDCDVAFDLTAGGGSGAAAADGRGPFQLISNIAVRVNGKIGWYNVSGYGTYLLDAIETRHSFPQDAPGTVYTTAPADVASRIFDYPVAADGTAHFGLDVPIVVTPDNPLAMLLLNNDQTTVTVELTLNTLDAYVLVAGGATATATLTVTATLEYFDIPPEDVFQSLFVPMLAVGHWFNETEKSIVAQGVGANVFEADTHDTYLGIYHTVILNGKVDTDHVDDVRLKLNTNQTRHELPAERQLRRQRLQWGKDLPMYAWDLFAEGNLRDALDGDKYTKIQSFLDISGATLGTNPRIITITEKLINLGA
jgi:hypothetical protein